MAGGREKGWVMVRLAPELVSHSLSTLVKIQGSPSLVVHPYQRVVFINTLEQISSRTFKNIGKHLIPGRGAGGDAGVVEVDALLLHTVPELLNSKAPLGTVNRTVSPREGGSKGGTKEVDTPGNDHVVVVDDEDGVEEVCQSDSLEDGDTAERDNYKYVGRRKLRNVYFSLNILLAIMFTIYISHQGRWGFC